MANISMKRQKELRKDENTVRKLYENACNRWGKEEVNKDLTRLWDLRCIWGMQRMLPFTSTNFKDLGEMLWIAREVCKFGKEVVPIT